MNMNKFSSEPELVTKPQLKSDHVCVTSYLLSASKKEVQNVSAKTLHGSSKM